MTSLRERWAAGGTTIGAWLSNPSPVSAELAARIGFDYCVSVIGDGEVAADIRWSEEILPIGAE